MRPKTSDNDFSIVHVLRFQYVLLNILFNVCSMYLYILYMLLRFEIALLKLEIPFEDDS